MITTNIKINGMKCDHCKKRVDEALKNINEIKKVKIDLKTGNVKITSDEEMNMNNIKDIIDSLGFELEM